MRTLNFRATLPSHSKEKNKIVLLRKIKTSSQANWQIFLTLLCSDLQASTLNHTTIVQEISIKFFNIVDNFTQFWYFLFKWLWKTKSSLLHILWQHERQLTLQWKNKGIKTKFHNQFYTTKGSIQNTHKINLSLSLSSYSKWLH